MSLKNTIKENKKPILGIVGGLVLAGGSLLVAALGKNEIKAGEVEEEPLSEEEEQEKAPEQEETE